MMFVRVKNQDGVEALVTEEAFELVWKHRGFTLIEDDEKVEQPKPRSKRKDSTK